MSRPFHIVFTIENGIEGVKETILSQASSFLTFTYGDFSFGGGCNTKCGVHVALARLISFLHGSLNMKSIILGKYHYVLYFPSPNYVGIPMLPLNL
jgi:hypothetical protein